MTFRSRGLVLLAAALLSGCRRAAPEAPDLIVLNGKVWTGDVTRPEAEAIAIRNGRILTVANSDVVRAMASAETRIIDVEGRRVVPGFNDAHWHLPLRETADLAGAGNVDEIVRRLEAFATGPPDAWVVGDGWGPSDFPGLQPHRRYLDAAFPDRPVLITDRDGHQVLANSRAMALADITRETPDPPNGRIGRDARGELTGLLQEGAMRLAQRLLPPVSAADADRALRTTLQKASSYGLTSVQDASASDPSGHRVAAYERAWRAGTLPVRVRVAMPFEKNVTQARLAELVRLRDEHKDRWLSFGIVKGMLDGTVDGHTAAMLEPYADRPNESGLPMWDQAALNAAVAVHDQAGLEIELHAVGDRAIRMALDAFARARSLNGTSERRHRIEHAELPSPEDLPRFRSLGVIASTQAMCAGVTTAYSLQPA